ncbi:hypothetical protein [Actinoplanes sp. TFC3]|uniref:hypothetical protein n=1 Tax=Actinoplanes sp. TFC3 TaxID=1710355 RepID=UPI0008307AFE|nr:hypothetical protein [Actinoplanes sp. TFC3]
MTQNRTRRSKFSALALASDHYGTLKNFQTGRYSPADVAVHFGIPVALAVLVWALGATARNIPDVLAAVAIFTGLIFNVFVLIFDLTARATDKLEAESRALVDRLADELRANVSYAVLVGIVFTAILGGVTMFIDTEKPLGVAMTALVVFVGVHMLLTVFMILKRVRAMFRSFRLRQAEIIP